MFNINQSININSIININKKSKSRCIFNGCNRFPSYNVKNSKIPLFCKKHKLENMIDVKNKKCIFENCNTRPTYNLSTEKTAIYCMKHKLENMINIVSKKCIFENCNIRSTYNLSTEKTAIYCMKHKLENMVDITRNKCSYIKCKNTNIYGYMNKRPQFCINHKLPDMINLILENKCSTIDCNNEYDLISYNIKYCNVHIPINSLDIIKKLCKYCDIRGDIDYICKDCLKIKNKKEYAIVRLLRKEIDTPFIYDSNRMLQNCTKKRPDIYFELTKHCVIVEVDENQHNIYDDKCECGRLNEIVNGIGGKSVIIIRYNPDTIRNNNKIIEIKQIDKIELLIKTIKKELVKEYNEFVVKIIQLFYNDNYEIYKPIKKENITKIVCI